MAELRNKNRKGNCGNWANESNLHNCFPFQPCKVREPFSVMSLLKSPMGLMVGFMVLMVFVMPKMMENIGKFQPFDTHELDNLSIFSILHYMLRN